MIRVVVAEDQALVLGAIATLLGYESDIEVVGRATDGDQALELVRAVAPDILLSDIEMPQRSGIEVAQAIADERLPTHVVIVTTFGRPGYLRRAQNAGVRGYLLKDSPVEQLAAAIRTVAGGGRAIAADLATAAWEANDPLTERERASLRLAEEGLSNKEIGRKLSLSPGTVRNYLSEAAAKVGANNRVEAGRIARENGWL